MLDRLSRYPLLLALLAHLIATLLLALLLYAWAGVGSWRPPLLLVGLVQGGLAAGLGWRLGLSRWWLPINLAFVPGLILVAGYQLPAWFYLAGFLILLLLNWNSFRERVPLYLTGSNARAQLAALLDEQPAGFAFIDLGCGLGGTLGWLARHYPQGRFVGVETAPLVFAIAWLRCLPLRNCRVHYRSLWKTSLAPYDLVYCFLSPAPMPALWRKVQAEMRPGTLLVSNSFDIPGAEPSWVQELADWRKSRLFGWRIGKSPGSAERARH